MSQPFGNQPTTPLGGGPAPVGGPTAPGAFAQQPYAPPPQKSKFWFWLLGGCGCAVVLMAICCGGISLFGVYKGKEFAGGVMQELIKQEVADNEDVKEHIGDIEKISINTEDSASEKKARGGKGNWMVFDAEGTKGNGQFVTEMPFGGSNGSPFGKIELRTEDGKTFQIK